MTKEDCICRGRACTLRFSVDEEYPICSRILGQLNGRFNDKSHIARKCRKHYLEEGREHNRYIELIGCGCFMPDEDKGYVGV